MHKRLKTIIDAPEEDLPLADFEDLAGWGETRYVERKSMRLASQGNAKHLKEAIGKFTSATANYDGGVLLLGVDDNGTVETDGIADEKGNGSYKEWLEDVVAGSTTPTVPTYCVKRVQAAGEGHLFLIIVGPSHLAPHQSTDYRYYGRIDGKSRPINGLMVLDIFSRQEQAVLEPSFHIDSRTLMNQEVIIVQLRVDSPARVAKNIVATVEFTTNVTPAAETWSSGRDRFTGIRAELHADLVFPNVTQEWRKLHVRKLPHIEGDLMVVAENVPARQWTFDIDFQPGGYVYTLTPADAQN